MTTSTETAPSREPGMIDISGSTKPPMTRLVGVEIRKMTDTRAGMWLLITIAAITVIVNGAMLIWGPDDLGFIDFLQFAGIPQGVLLPVLAVLLVTQEWGQRTGLVTFSLVPNRNRVLAAKFIAAIVFVLAAFAVAFVIAVVLTPLSSGSDPWAGMELGLLSRVVLSLVIGGAWGYAFGVALLNSAFAIVAYFLVPTLIGIVGGIWTTAHDTLLWFDLGTTQAWLYQEGGPSGEEWAQIGVGALIWIGLPIVIGFLRINRAEIK